VTGLERVWILKVLSETQLSLWDDPSTDRMHNHMPQKFTASADTGKFKG